MSRLINLLLRIPRPVGVGLGWCLVAVIWAASLLTPPTTGLEIPNEDKWGHLIAYGSLMGWFCLWYPRRAARVGYFVGFAAMGVLLELLQSQLPARQASALDLLANTVGLLLGWLVMSLVWKRRA